MVHIVSGVYHFSPRRLAFRNDYCLSCEEGRRTTQVRTFDVIHIFWVPILPLGFWKRWICMTCGRDAHVNRKTRRGFKWAGLFVLIICSLLFWAEPPPGDFVVGGWIFRIGLPIGAVLLLVHLLRTPKGPTLEERLAKILPAQDTVCPYCGKHLLVINSRCSCPGCGVVRC